MSKDDFADPLDALAYDLWANPDDDDEPFDDDFLDSPLIEPLALDDLKSAVRDGSIPSEKLVAAHHAWEQEWTAGAGAASPAPRRSAAPRLAGDNRPRHGQILLQRARVQLGDFLTDDELRVFLAERTQWNWADLVQPIPRGRLTPTERRWREELARLVRLARSRGAAFETLARVLNRSLATVHALATSASA